MRCRAHGGAPAEMPRHRSPQSSQLGPKSPSGIYPSRTPPPPVLPSPMAMSLSHRRRLRVGCEASCFDCSASTAYPRGRVS
eukprot:scaffold58322_cov67-Phaeocystis_antarctica.AAC.2